MADTPQPNPSESATFNTPQDSRAVLESKLTDIFFKAAGGVSDMAKEEVAAILPAIDTYAAKQVAAAERKHKQTHDA